MINPIGDDFVKRYRLEYNREALEGVRDKIKEKAYSRLRDLLEYRLTGREFDRSPTGMRIALAFSAGSDSTASLKILRWAGFEVVPITARLPQMRPEEIGRASREGAVFVEIQGYGDEMKELMEKRAPICGRCHSMVMNAMEEKAIELGVGILATGDLLSSGLISVYPKGELVILNLPAFLALDKGEVVETTGGRYDFSFGCRLWKLAARDNPSIKRYGIQRVLRETRARALRPEMAVKLIEDILLS
ncbi:ATPase [Thermococcus sp.]|uniref:ATPase n=1 Tax=Thermococcus sp. TaxID=35749 RepID=UPI002605E859|nr:ATPase [Thermococcus sp.]